MTRLHLFVSIFLAALLTATSVLAVTDPIPGIDIIVKKNPGPIVQHVTTDDNGNFHLNKLPDLPIQVRQVLAMFCSFRSL